MSDPDPRPQETTCVPHASGDAATATVERPGVQVLAPRDVPLGGPRAMHVRRTLPHRDRSFVGAWCFVDHYGPDPVATAGGMDVPPHPHAGLQTVSWLFQGEVEHHDSGGAHVVVRPGEVNLMTAGFGIAHSEVSTAGTSVLHGVQLWVVLPEADRGLARELQHHACREVEAAPGVRLRVFVGGLAGQVSPVRTRTPLLGAEVLLAAGTTWRVDVPAGHEHGVLVDAGVVRMDGTTLRAGELGVRDTGPETLELVAEADARLVLLGGAPYDEQIVMWWNFIGRDHDDVVAQREAWQAGSSRFGDVPGYPGELSRLPAPTLPNGTLRARTRRPAG
jgi:redox-sensitive bicupin YhaK (pirin superfamily)